MEKKYDIEYKLDLKGKHLLWAKPYSNGTIKALFIPGVRFGREIVELAQRTDICFETVTIDRDWDLNKWGIAEYYDLRGGIWDFEIAYKNLEMVLTSDEKFDVMILPGLNGWGYYTEKTREAIVKRVENGTGLILIKPFNGEGTGQTEILEKLSPLKNLFEEGFVTDRYAGEGFPELKSNIFIKEVWTAKKHYITDGIPFDLFPYSEMACYPYEACGDVIIKTESGFPVAAVKEYGKGRIIAFGYYPRNILPQHSAFHGRENTYDPNIDLMEGARHSLSFNYLEYFYGLIYRSMIWASRKEPLDRIEKLSIKKDTMIMVQTKNENNALGFRIQDAYDNIVYEKEINSGLEFEFPPSLLTGGEFRCDVFLKKDGKINDWATISVTIPLSASIKNMDVNALVLTYGDKLIGNVEYMGCCGEIDLQVIDDFGRVLQHVQKNIVTDGSMQVYYQIEDLQSQHITIRAEILIDGRLIHRKDSEKIQVTPRDRKLHDFEVFMASSNRGQGDFWELQRMLSLELGVTGIFPGNSKMLSLSGAEGLGRYWYYRFPYVERKEKYLETRDKRFLERVPCLNDPVFWQVNSDHIRKEVQKNKKFGPISYYANDEGSLTCYTDALDLCFCTHCMHEMRKWLKSIYKDINELNRIWGTSFSDWDCVVPYTKEEARESRQYASWGDHRTFMELTFANAYKKIRDLIHESDPEGVIRMSGSQASTAYTGYDYYQLHQYIGYFEAYPSGNQMEFHRSFAAPNTIIGGWYGYGNRGIALKKMLWHALLHNLTLISLFCEFCHLHPDFTIYSGALDSAVVLKEIRRKGIGKLLLYASKRDNLGIAIHYSMASIHGSTILGMERRFENNREGWTNILEDLGYQYDFIATPQIERGELLEKGYKLLILPLSIALTDQETSNIKRFTENGGSVIGDFQTGIMDEHCKKYNSGKLDDLFGIRRLSVDAEPFFVNNEFLRRKDFHWFELEISGDSGMEAEEIGIRVSTGVASYTDDFSRKVCSVIVNKYGKGKAVYLNIALDKYPMLVNETGGASDMKKLVNLLLELAGIEKAVRLKTLDNSNIDKGYEVVVYREGNAKYVAILKATEASKVANFDGLVYSKDRGIAASSKVKVCFAEQSHVYDIREGNYFGFTDEIEIVIEEGEATILSSLPDEAVGIKVNIAEEVSRGDTLEMNLEMFSTKRANNLSNVWSINFYNPEGNYEWIYSGNEIVNGSSFRKHIKIPFNERTGIWKLVVREVASGREILKEFKVK